MNGRIEDPWVPCPCATTPLFSLDENAENYCLYEARLAPLPSVKSIWELWTIILYLGPRKALTDYYFTMSFFYILRKDEEFKNKFILFSIMIQKLTIDLQKLRNCTVNAFYPIKKRKNISFRFLCKSKIFLTEIFIISISQYIKDIFQ